MDLQSISMEMLKLFTHRADINSSYLKDTALRFPPPEHLLPRRGPEASHLIWPTDWDSLNATVEFFILKLRSLQSLVNEEKCERDLWQDTSFPGYNISPLLGDLLVIRPAGPELDPLSYTFEAFRLAALLYGSRLRGLFGLDTFSTDTLYCAKLYSLLSSVPPCNWDTGEGLLVWVLAVGLTGRAVSNEQQTGFLEHLHSILPSIRISSLEQLHGLLCEMVWDEDLFKEQSETLKALFPA
jgi:hypothetical protein